MEDVGGLLNGTLTCSDLEGHMCCLHGLSALGELLVYITCRPNRM